MYICTWIGSVFEMHVCIYVRGSDQYLRCMYVHMYMDACMYICTWIGYHLTQLRKSSMFACHPVTVCVLSG